MTVLRRQGFCGWKFLSSISRWAMTDAKGSQIRKSGEVMTLSTDYKLQNQQMALKLGSHCRTSSSEMLVPILADSIH